MWFPGEQHTVCPLKTDLVFTDSQYLLNTYYVLETINDLMVNKWVQVSSPWEPQCTQEGGQ